MDIIPKTYDARRSFLFPVSGFLAPGQPTATLTIKNTAHLIYLMENTTVQLNLKRMDSATNWWEPCARTSLETRPVGRLEPPVRLWYFLPTASLWSKKFHALLGRSWVHRSAWKGCAESVGCVGVSQLVCMRSAVWHCETSPSISVHHYFYHPMHNRRKNNDILPCLCCNKSRYKSYGVRSKQCLSRRCHSFSVFRVLLPCLEKD